jgi:hypothetical protein
MPKIPTPAVYPATEALRLGASGVPPAPARRASIRSNCTAIQRVQREGWGRWWAMRSHRQSHGASVRPTTRDPPVSGGTCVGRNDRSKEVGSPPVIEGRGPLSTTSVFLQPILVRHTLVQDVGLFGHGPFPDLRHYRREFWIIKSLVSRRQDQLRAAVPVEVHHLQAAPIVTPTRDAVEHPPPLRFTEIGKDGELASTASWELTGKHDARERVVFAPIRRLMPLRRVDYAPVRPVIVEKLIVSRLYGYLSTRGHRLLTMRVSPSDLDVVEVTHPPWVLTGDDPRVSVLHPPVVPRFPRRTCRRRDYWVTWHD